MNWRGCINTDVATAQQMKVHSKACFQQDNISPTDQCKPAHFHLASNSAPTSCCRKSFSSCRYALDFASRVATSWAAGFLCCRGRSLCLHQLLLDELFLHSTPTDTVLQHALLLSGIQQHSLHGCEAVLLQQAAQLGSNHIYLQVDAWTWG